MKNYRTLFGIVLAMGSLVFLSQCKKETEIVEKTITVTVHDTINGKAISGLATYPDYQGTTTPAAGAVVSLYLGTSATGNVVATAFADASGNYRFPYLLPGAYFIYAKYNTDNQNYKPIEGINFETDPGYAVTMGSSNITQNLSLISMGATGDAKLTIVADDTLTNPSLKYVTVESHSSCTFWVKHLDDTIGPGLTMAGGWPSPGFKLKTFVFDEANPANSYFNGYVLTSMTYTGNPGRDTVRGSCVDGFFNHDTIQNASGPASVLAQTDTAYYWANAGQVEKYGSGYLAKGTLAPVWKHQGGEIVPPKTSPCNPDTLLGYNGQLGWNKRIELPVDMFFEYQGKKKVWNSSGTTFYWYFEFEGQFTFSRTAFYMRHGLGDMVTVNPHLQIRGMSNTEY